MSNKLALHLQKNRLHLAHRATAVPQPSQGATPGNTAARGPAWACMEIVALMFAKFGANESAQSQTAEVRQRMLCVIYVVFCASPRQKICLKIMYACSRTKLKKSAFYRNLAIYIIIWETRTLIHGSKLCKFLLFTDLIMKTLFFVV